MDLRKARNTDIDKIEPMIYMAKNSLKNDGVDQWQKSNPNKEMIISQIAKGDGFVIYEGDDIYGYTKFTKEAEPTYEILKDKFKGYDYYVIHTFMVDSKKNIRGLGKDFMRLLIKFAKDNNKDSIRVDTHHDNFRMRGLLEKFSFVEIGDIKVDEDGVLKARIAYELVL